MKNFIFKANVLGLIDLAQSALFPAGSFPDYTSNALAPSVATTSCYHCIKGGWQWCDDGGSQYSFEPATTQRTVKCCDSNSTQSSYTNAACDVGYDSSNNLKSTAVCTSQFKSTDLAIVS
jgi:hypothetical protein